MRTRVRLAVVVGLLSVVAVGVAQDAPEPFRWTGPEADVAVAPTGAATVAVTLIVHEGHYVYQHSLAFEPGGAQQGLAVRAVAYPKAKYKYDEFQEKELAVYPAGEHTFDVGVGTAGLAAGTAGAELAVRFQGCSQQSCFLPQRVVLPVTLQVPDAAANLEPPREQAAEPGRGVTALDDEDTDSVAGLVQRGEYLSLLLLLFLGGLASSLLPCVYPIIPITISVIGASQTKNYAQAFGLSLVFVLGLALTFSLLGVVAAMAGQLAGAFMASDPVMLVLAALFFALAFAMFGLYELRLPAAVTNKLSTMGGQGIAGAFVMGTVAGILATPCTGPVLAGVLAYIAQTQNPVFGFIALLVYALGLGVLFLVVGTFSGLLAVMPRSGGWMDVVKSVFGVVFLAIAFYYGKALVPAVQDYVAPAFGPIVLGLVLTVVGVGLGALQLTYKKGAPVRNTRKTVGVLAAGVGLFLVFASAVAEPRLPGDWRHDYNEARELAREAGRPLLLDFYTENCTNCKKLSRVTFSDAEVARELERFVKAKVDLTDNADPHVQELIERYDIVGVPLLVFYDSAGQRLPERRIAGFVGPQAFLLHIQQIE